MRPRCLAIVGSTSVFLKAVSRRSTGSLLKTHPRLGELVVHHSSIVGRCPARTNVRVGSKPEKLDASKCFPLCPESGHRAMQSACPFCANFGSDPISFDHLIGAALGARAPDALHIGSGVLVIPATPPAAVRRSSFPVAARATANRETN